MSWLSADKLVEIGVGFQPQSKAQKRQRLLELHNLAKTIEARIPANVDRWNDVYCGFRAAARNAMTLACLPSLETLIRSRPHNLEVNQAVDANFQTLFERIMGSNNVNVAMDRYKRRDELGQPVCLVRYMIGALSEMAVHGAIVATIADGHRAASEYILPATVRQDKGQDLAGLRLKSDLVLRKSGDSSFRTFFEVKNRLIRSDNSDISVTHYPGIVTISPGVIFDEDWLNPLELMAMSADRQSGVLSQIH